MMFENIWNKIPFGKKWLPVFIWGLAFFAVISVVQPEGKAEESRLRSSSDGNIDAAQASSVEIDQPINTALRLAFGALMASGVVFALAFMIKRTRENQLGLEDSSSLLVRDSVWIGRGQRILLLAFGEHKVLVGVSGGSIHSLGVFSGNEEPQAVLSPIEREAAMLTSQRSKSSEFADFVKGELAGSLTGRATPKKDRRQQMVAELNSL